MKVAEELKRLGRVRLIIVLSSFTVAVAVLLVVGIALHSEPTLAHPERAWTAEGPLTTPLRVACYGSDGRCSSAQTEVRTINRRTGFPMLHYVGESTHSEITLVLGGDNTGRAECPDEGGCFYLQYNVQAHRYVQCLAYTVNMGWDRALEADVIAHELGHCLGLAHDDYSDSIMYPVQRLDEGRLPSRMSDADIGALQDRYAP